MVKEHLEITIKDINSQFNLVLEGHESLRGKIRELAKKTDERFDLVDFKIDTLNQKIDAVAVDLKATDKRLSDKIDTVDEKLSKKIDAVASDLGAHRQDTEAHGGMYCVKEG